MKPIVQKFGGSSVADVEKMGRVADHVVATRKLGHDVVCVVSAMGKTTDQLLALARTVAPPPFEPPRRELDMLLSTGERVAMSLLSIAIAARGHEAISFTGSQSGIITNDRHFDARIIEVRPHRVEDELARGKIVIIAGYQGMSYRREITTLGRGGSDTTAVAMAAALGAERCEIYSDVDGIYSADPRVVPHAQQLPEVDLACLQEMAEAGAKVVCAQAVEWARKNRVTLHARRTGDTLGRETVAREGLSGDVRAVVGCSPVALVSGERLLPLLAELELTPLDASTGDPPGGAVATIPLLNVPDWALRRDALVRARAEVDEELAAVSVVGQNLAAAETLRRFDEVVGHEVGREARCFVSPLRLSAVVPRASEASLTRALHGAFIDRSPDHSPRARA